MRRETYTFPVKGDPLDSYVEHCEHSRAAYKYLQEHQFSLADEHSAVQVWHDEDDGKHFAWCYCQLVGKERVLRVYHLDGPAGQTLGTPQALFQDPQEALLEVALDTLDAFAFPPQSIRDVLGFIKQECLGQLLEITIASLEDMSVSDLQERHEAITELLAYCNAMGAQ